MYNAGRLQGFAWLKASVPRPGSYGTYSMMDGVAAPGWLVVCGLTKDCSGRRLLLSQRMARTGLVGNRAGLATVGIPRWPHQNWYWPWRECGQCAVCSV